MKILPISVNAGDDFLLDVLRPRSLSLIDNPHQVDVVIHTYNWDYALSALQKIAKSRTGPVISQIGSTWIGDLVPQKVLRPFSQGEIASFGGQDKFLPSAWKNTSFEGDPQTYSIPWIVDTNVLYFRRDLLQQAGVNESTAFTSTERLSATLSSLNSSGHALPWISNSGVRSHGVVHHISNWVYGRGGRFVSSDGRKAEFNSSAARAGIRDYFELQRYLKHAVYFLSESQAADRFFMGEAAVLLAAPTYLRQMKAGRYDARVVENIGVAVPPGIPYVGGSNWVIWSHISPEMEPMALEFLTRVCSTESQVELHEKTGQLPARMEAMAQIARQDHYVTVQKTLQKGQTFPATPAWAVIENKLADVFYEISNNLIIYPQKDIEALLDQYLAPAEESLSRTLMN